MSMADEGSDLDSKNIRSKFSRSSHITQAARETLEAPNHAKEKRQVLDAITNLNFKVTAGSVAEQTGLPVLKVSSLLNRVAYETQGQLVVDTAGGVMYKFAPNFQASYLINGSKHAFQWLFRVIFNALAMAIRVVSLAIFFVLRISFGILLIASVVLVVVLIVAAVVSFFMKLADESGGGFDLDGGGGGGGDLGAELTGGLSFDWLSGIQYWTFDWLWDWYYWGRYFYWDPWSPWYGGYGYREHPDHYQVNSASSYSQSSSSAGAGYAEQETEAAAEKIRASNTNFLDNCFAWLFGVGDPNTDIEMERWRVVAHAIKAKSGVVLAEDVAPYVEAKDKGEDWMLPVLIRFNGYPEVSDSGKLIYCFPDLIPASVTSGPSVSGSSTTQTPVANELSNLYSSFLKRQSAQKTTNANARALPQFIHERDWLLTSITGTEAMSVLFFACLASGGAIGLLHYAGTYKYVEMARPLLLGIAAYGSLFIWMPLLRLPWVLSRNAAISKRNEAHLEAAQKLAHPDAELAKHMQEADAYRSSLWSGETKVAYTTETDLLEQQFQPQ